MTGPGLSPLTLLLSCLVLFQLWPPWAAHAAAEALRPGERIYREGMLPSGRLLMIEGGAVPGTRFSCVSCHLRSGLGYVQEGIHIPAVDGAHLFSPTQVRYQRFGEKSKLFFKIPLQRPPYTGETLARAIRDGVDPTGRRLDPVMPRYRLDDREMALLIGYLKSLCAEESPGVSDGTVRFATVLTDDVTPAEREALLDPLQRFIAARNNQSAYLRQLSAQGKLRMGANLMPPPTQSLSLSVWQLGGPPDTWRSQLEEHYRKEPVFALIGGITNGDWGAVQRFSEENAIPTLFPATDFPVISRSDWYTLYLSKGYAQEGEAAAAYLSAMAEKIEGRPILQIVRDSREGRTLAQAFADAWRGAGHAPPETVMLKPGEALTKAGARQLLAKGRPAAVLLWDGPAALPALEALGGGEYRPELVFVSARYLGEELWSLKEELRDIVYLTYPFRLSDQLPSHVESANPALRFSTGATKAGNQAYAIAEVVTAALAEMKGNYYRDYFLDVIDTLEGVDVPLYERLGFGLGQRFASKGCYIVQLSRDAKPVLIRKSDWMP